MLLVVARIAVPCLSRVDAKLTFTIHLASWMFLGEWQPESG